MLLSLNLKKVVIAIIQSVESYNSDRKKISCTVIRAVEMDMEVPCLLCHLRGQCTDHLVEVLVFLYVVGLCSAFWSSSPRCAGSSNNQASLKQSKSSGQPIHHRFGISFDC